MKKTIDEIRKSQHASGVQLEKVLSDDSENEYLFAHANEVRKQYFGNKIYIRGLIEFTSYCKNNCYYCGLRYGNSCAKRYRLNKEQIMSCCREGYGLGFRTFVLQGGEDMYFTAERLCDIVSSIKKEWNDCAVTLSVGEKTDEEYKQLYNAGADRYLLRHETASPKHYAQLHPPELSLENRISCLNSLRSIGYQTGAGFMIGSPFQTTDNIVCDILFLQDFRPHMIGVGPFIPHSETPFGAYPSGSVTTTLKVLAILRLISPRVLLPATTALGTLSQSGRQQGILAGANVVMPNLSPVEVRKKYLLYDNKLCTDLEAAENLSELRTQLEEIGCEIAVGRGDSTIDS